VNTLFELRIAETDDREAIFGLITELQESQVSRSDFDQIFGANLESPDIYYFVATEKEAIVGFISVHIQKLLHHASGIAEIQEVIVTKDLQGKGIGKLLFEKAKEIAVLRECLQLEVCCNQKRLDAHAFYENRGMTNHHYKFCVTL